MPRLMVQDELIAIEQRPKNVLPKAQPILAFHRRLAVDLQDPRRFRGGRRPIERGQVEIIQNRRGAGGLLHQVHEVAFTGDGVIEMAAVHH